MATVFRTIRLSPEQDAALVQAAAKAGYKAGKKGGIGEFIRRTLFRRIGLPVAQAVRPEGNPAFRAAAEDGETSAG